MNEDVIKEDLRRKREALLAAQAARGERPPAGHEQQRTAPLPAEEARQFGIVEASNPKEEAPPPTRGRRGAETAAERVMNNGAISRPGISSEFLTRHRIRHVDEEQAETLTGFRASGIWIPYPGLSSSQMTANDRPFGRLRPDRPLNGNKYLSPRGSGAQLYIPQGAPFGKEIVICEGEFKALALCEANIRAVSIGGIQSAMTEGEPIPDLRRILRKYNPRTIYFLGDSDTSLIFDFSREAVKLARAIAPTTLKVPRIPLSMPKGIDDVREALRDQFMEFWQRIIAEAVEVSTKADPSMLAVRLLTPELPAVAKSQSRDEYETRIIKLAGQLSPVALDKLAREAKKHLALSIGAFKQAAGQRNYEDGREPQLPDFYFDGSRYLRPFNEGFEPITREDASLHLRSVGFRHRTAHDCELSPCEAALHRLQTEKRVDYAGPLCGRPPGLCQEGQTRILCTRGPKIIEAEAGDASPINGLLCSLFGKGRDSHFNTQIRTFCAWLHRARKALLNPGQHLPGQALALVGPRDCGKSLLQSLITQMLGGREADPALWLVKGANFNAELWGAEHLRLGDEELAEDRRDRHALRDRIKKIVVADLYPLHAKHRDAHSFRPIWRLTISGNDDDESVAVLPPPTDSFADKIIYLRSFPPVAPYHDGTDEGSRAFWRRLTGAIPAFLHEVEILELPEELRSSRFYVRAFHHPTVVECIADASPVAPLGELLDLYLDQKGEVVQGSAAELYEALANWAGQLRLTQYSKSVQHFGHQLFRLSKLAGWRERITRVPRRVGGRKRNQRQNVWRISPADIAEMSNANI